MKLKLIAYLAAYGAVVSFIAIGIQDTEAVLGQTAAIDCRYDINNHDGKIIKENNLNITSKKIKDTKDSVYISLFIYNRGPEELTLGSRNFILMKKSAPICELSASRVSIHPEKSEEIILSYPKTGAEPDCIEVVKYAGRKTYQKLFSIKL